jgi:AcrR family transcriptional regulator
LSRTVEIEAPAPTSADEVRERILDAAAAEFVEFGLRRTTVEAVARRAGIGRMTLYRRFAGKEELVRAVVLRELQAFMAELDELMAAEAPLVDQMVESFVFTVLHAREHPLFGRLLDTDPEATLPYVTLDGATMLESGIAFTVQHIRATPESKGMSTAGIRRAAEASTRLAQSMILTPGGSAASPAAIRVFARQSIPALLDSARG